MTRYHSDKIFFSSAGRSMRITPRRRLTSPSDAKRLSMRATTSLAELTCRAISSCVRRSSREPVRSASESRKEASLRSKRANRTYWSENMTAEKRRVASSYIKHRT